jgi:tyrosinase
MPTIQVIATNGVMQTIPNPLYRYEFHPLIPGDFDGKVRLTVSGLL